MSEPPAAFEQLFRDYYDPVYRYATRRVAAEAVQDVVSETFLAPGADTTSCGAILCRGCSQSPDGSPPTSSAATRGVLR